jgi:hypothetical protein
MNFDSTDKSCRFRSFAEAERYAEQLCQDAEKKVGALCKVWGGYGVYVIDGNVSYSPPQDKSRIKRMCLGCRRREVFGKELYCKDSGCIARRARNAKLKKQKLGDLAHTESSTYGGS